eukprot:gene5207-7067_t
MFDRPHVFPVHPMDVLKDSESTVGAPLTDPLPLAAPDLRTLGLSGQRPLVLIDVDEVLGLFMQGFGDYVAMVSAIASLRSRRRSLRRACPAGKVCLEYGNNSEPETLDPQKANL